MSGPGRDGPPAPDPADETRTVIRQQGVAPGDLLAGRYRLREAIGRGGMGLVYRATDQRLGLDVALKVLRPEHVDDEEVAARFTREILLARQVSHRNVVRIHDLGEDAERQLAFLTMDLVEGLSLKRMMADEGRFEPARAAALVAQLADGLAAAHREGVVHRDLKPSNVLVDPDGHAYLTDFGIARSLTGGALTRTGGIVGTPRYLSPEQARGERVDPRSDIYSLGLILYEMLTGEGAFPDGTFTEMVSQRIAGEPRDVVEQAPEVPSWLVAVVRRCLRRDPEERYPDAAALATELALGLAALPTEGASPEVPGHIASPVAATTSAHTVEAAASSAVAQDPVGTGAAVTAAAGTGGRPAVRDLALAGILLLLVGALLWFLLAGWGKSGAVGDSASGRADDPLAPPIPAAHALVVLPLASGISAPGPSAAGPSTAGEGAGPRSIGMAQILEDSLTRRLTADGAGKGGEADLRVVDSLRAARTLSDLGLVGGELREPDLRQLADLAGADRVVAGRVMARGDATRIEGRLTRVGPSGVESDAVAAEADSLWAAMDAFADALLHRLAPDLAVNRRPAPGRGGEGSGAKASAGNPTFRAMTQDRAALAAYDAGVEALLRGDAVAAAPALERAVEADPGFAAAWVRLADAAAVLGRYETAETAAERAIAELPEDFDGRLGFEARARLAGLRGETAEAAEILARLVERHPGDLEARVAYGEAALDAGIFPQAKAALEAVTAVDPNHPRAWFLLGKLAILVGDYRRAADDYLVRALTLQNLLANRQGRADAENALGIARLNLGELDDASRHFEQAADLRREVGDRRGVAATLSNLGLVESQRGNYAAARKAFEESLAIRRDIGDRAGVAALYNSLGFLEEEQGTYREALAWYRRALEERRAGGDPRATAESLNNVGYAYYLLGDYDNAAVYWDRTLEIHRDSENAEGMLVTRQNLGLLDLARGEWDDARAAFLDTLETARSLGLPDAEAVSLGQLGEVARHQGRYGAAFGSYHQALRRVEEIQDPRGLAEFHLMVAAAALEVGLAAAAARSLEEAAGWLEEGGNRGQRGELARLRGALATTRGDAAPAARHLEEAAAAAEASGSRRLALAARLDRAELALMAARADGGGPGSARRAEALAASVAEEAAASGLRLVELRAGEVLAAARLAAGRPQAAVEAAAAALTTARRLAPYGRAFRLHRLHAAALEASAAKAAASGGGTVDTETGSRAAWRAATMELKRVRGGLKAEGVEAVTGVDSEEVQTAFDGLAVVAAIDRHRRSESAVTPAGNGH